MLLRSCIASIFIVLKLSAQTPPATLLDRAAAQSRAGDYKSALETLEAALTIVEREEGRDSVAAAGVCLKLAKVQFVRGVYKDGLTAAQRALTIFEGRPDPDQASVAEALTM